MILNKLSVLNYKNIRQADIVCSPKINCFFGNNGMGKTNLLDAIYYLSFCKSHVYTTEERHRRVVEHNATAYACCRVNISLATAPSPSFSPSHAANASNSSATKSLTRGCRTTSDCCRW